MIATEMYFSVDLLIPICTTPTTGPSLPNLAITVSGSPPQYTSGIALRKVDARLGEAYRRAAEAGFIVEKES